VLAVADRRHALVTRERLLAAGLTADAITHLLRTGRLHRVWPGVYAVGRPMLTREARWLAAVLACGRGAALGLLCAGALWEVWERAVPAWPQVCVPTGGGRRGPRGIQIHRSALDRAEVTTRYGIPVTSLPRTLLDFAGVLDASRLRSAIRQAERVHRLDLRTLRQSVEAPRKSVKHARLRRALDAYVPGAAATEADAEMVFLETCSRRGLPAPECQVPIGRWRADFMWRDVGLVVEIDDRRSHDGYVAFLEDRLRDRAMQARGLQVLRFTRREVLSDPAAVAREMADARARLLASRTHAAGR
jgi:very-short-patch-repair endonuclease